MKIGYFGDGPWAHLAIEKIIQSSHLEIAFIVARYDSKDPILAKYAAKLNVPFIVHPDVNAQEFIDIISKYNVDINVSMSFNQILKREIINLAPKGFINCHAGALPFYRGRNVLNWALINGETQFGVTVHYIDEGIDTGDIILRKFAPIDMEDDYGTVLTKAIVLCAETLYDALLLIKDEKVNLIKQDTIHPVGFYCGRRKSGDELLDWSWSSQRIYDFVRAINIPGPCARTFLRGKEIAVLSSEKIDNALSYIGKPGEVVGRGQKSLIVKTGDKTIRITEMAYINRNGSFEDLDINFPIGTTFNSDLLQKRIFDLESRVLFLENNFFK